MSLTSVDLPEPLTPVTATKQPSGNADGDVPQVVLARPDDGQLAARRRRPAQRGNVDGTAAGEVLTGDRVGAGEQVLDGARHDDLAAVLPRAGADVDDPVGGRDGVLVVLDDDQRVAEVPQPQQRLDEPPVVALVQTDARLVEDVEHADEARSRSAWPAGCAAPRRRRASPTARSSER